MPFQLFKILSKPFTNSCHTGVFSLIKVPVAVGAALDPSAVSLFEKLAGMVIRNEAGLAPEFLMTLVSRAVKSVGR